jgi:hypothetical protein
MLVAAGPAPSAGDGPAVLYFFVTPECEKGSEAARAAKEFARKHGRDATIRPVLLAQDFRLLRTLTDRSPLTRTLRELEKGEKPGSLNIPLFDEEGLHLAERWEVRAVPAFVLVRAGHAHRTSGSSGNLDQLWECSR